MAFGGIGGKSGGTGKVVLRNNYRMRRTRQVCGTTSYRCSTTSPPNPVVGRLQYSRTTDAAGKSRLSRMDALGRLEAVIENQDGAKFEAQYQLTLRYSGAASISVARLPAGLALDAPATSVLIGRLQATNENGLSTNVSLPAGILARRPGPGHRPMDSR